MQNNVNNDSIKIEKMTAACLDAVTALEEECFSIPWSRSMLSGELSGEHSHYYTATDENGVICGYCGLWHIVNEGHITKIAVHPLYRRRGIGQALMERMITLAYELEMMGLTLEARLNNAAAHGLYAKMGFKPEGIRKNYYSETNEDAVIMWKYL